MIAVAKVYKGGEPDYSRAAKVFARLPDSIPRDDLGEYPTAVLKRCWGHFMKHGDVKDDPRSGRPVNISDEDALAASELVKAGRSISRKTKAGPITIIVYFTTVREAVTLLPELKQIMDRNHATPKQLYEAMKRADPFLTKRTIVLKPAFTAAQIKARVDFAKHLLREMGMVHTLRVQFWSRVVQCDEGRWTYNTKNKVSKQVLIDKRTTLLHDYITCPKIKGQEEMSVHFFMCVSPHPGFAQHNGLVYWEFTTGTTNIRRLRNTLGQTEYEAFEYTVSYIIAPPCSGAHHRQKYHSYPEPCREPPRAHSHAGRTSR